MFLGIQTCVQVCRPRFLPLNKHIEVGQLNQKLTHWEGGQLLRTTSGAVWGLAGFEASSPWADVVGGGTFGWRALYATSVSIQVHKPWFGSRPHFFFRQRCNAYLPKHKSTLSYRFLPLRDRGLVGWWVFLQWLNFFQVLSCHSAFREMPQNPGKEQSAGQYNETGPSDISGVPIKFQTLSQEHWQAGWFCEVQVAKICSVTVMTCRMVPWGDASPTTAGYPACRAFSWGKLNQVLLPTPLPASLSSGGWTLRLREIWYEFVSAAPPRSNHLSLLLSCEEHFWFPVSELFGFLFSSFCVSNCLHFAILNWCVGICEFLSQDSTVIEHPVKLLKLQTVGSSRCPYP